MLKGRKSPEFVPAGFRQSLKGKSVTFLQTLQSTKNFAWVTKGASRFIGRAL